MGHVQKQSLLWCVLLHACDSGSFGFDTWPWFEYPDSSWVRQLPLIFDVHFVPSLEHLSHNSSHSYWQEARSRSFTALPMCVLVTEGLDENVLEERRKVVLIVLKLLLDLEYPGICSYCHHSYLCPSLEMFACLGEIQLTELNVIFDSWSPAGLQWPLQVYVMVGELKIVYFSVFLLTAPPQLTTQTQPSFPLKLS